MSPTSRGYFCMHSSASFCAIYKFNLLRFAKCAISFQSITTTLTHHTLHSPTDFHILHIQTSESTKFSAYSPIPCYNFIKLSTSAQSLWLLACTRTLFYLTVQLTLGTQCSLLFQFVMSQGPSILVQCPAVYIRFLLTTFIAKCQKCFPSACRQASYIKNTLIAYQQLYKFSKLKGSGKCRLLDKIISLCK